MKVILTAFSGRLRSEVIEYPLEDYEDIYIPHNPNLGISKPESGGYQPSSGDMVRFSFHGTICVDELGEPIYEFKLNQHSFALDSAN